MDFTISEEVRSAQQLAQQILGDYTTVDKLKVIEKQADTHDGEQEDLGCDRYRGAEKGDRRRPDAAPQGIQGLRGSPALYVRQRTAEELPGQAERVLDIHPPVCHDDHRLAATQGREQGFQLAGRR